MANDVVYEEPTLTFWEKAKAFWNYFNVYPEGYTKEGKKRLEEGKTKMANEFKKDLDKTLKDSVEMANERARAREDIVKGIKKPIVK